MTAGSVCAPLIIPIVYQEEERRAKNHINTNTPVSVQSDSPGVNIFYTLDGSKPIVGRSVMRRTMEGGGGCSHRYKQPILLPAGRVSVRAVAVSSDGRESSVVTKVFLVDLLDSDNRKQTKEKHPRSERQNSAGSSLRPPSTLQEAGSDVGVRANLSCSPQRRDDQSHDHTSSCRLSTMSSVVGRHSLQVGPCVLTRLLGSPTSSPFNASNAPQIKKENKVLQCSQCHSLRPSDPFARFCSQCGAVVPPLPEQRLPPVEGGQVFCVFCNTVVPVNAQTCLICDASVKPEAQLSLQDLIVCGVCGSGNPGHMTTCLTCENQLQLDGCVTSVPSGQGRMLSCSRCKRLNQSDARFCDWCGCRPAPPTSCVTCWQCGAGGPPYALYCAACGEQQEAVAPPTMENGPSPHQAMHQSDCIPNVKVAPPTVDQCTQTVGLYFPSAAELHNKGQQRALLFSREQPSRDRQPPRSAISPGRGYWRKQLDHICAHLRSYTQNNAPFRTLVGEPRLGRLVSAVFEDDGCEVTLTVSFVSAASKKAQVFPEDDVVDLSDSLIGPVGRVLSAGRTGSLSSIMERFTDNSSGGDLSNKGSELSTGGIKRYRRNLTPKPAMKDVQLLKELGPGLGHVSVIQELLDQGADPSCCDPDGRHALAVAVVSGHHDVLPVLLQRGADVDQKSGRMKNTALHEAAARGSEGLQCAQVLLSCRASVRQQNANGQTAYEVAVSSGCDNMVALLNNHAGRHLLDKSRKPKPSLDVF
ncbi:double zinc ribbon and ankyrin repeat-containing protein 1 isoform X2 [Cynoglossus semilaevis]|uniref:double zinc ribbon and ankyrin repeat-containing protein 1 isoform X2 n=1 Tax=Cynoglossus semilaevis TaxID=244447 RepID=UPI0004951B94|nr:double zinc ribbon and ankyrin repeat-containing protein 1 isoform X2 [Cynoglossus semilaevis]